MRISTKKRSSGQKSHVLHRRKHHRCAGTKEYLVRTSVITAADGRVPPATHPWRKAALTVAAAVVAGLLSFTAGPATAEEPANPLPVFEFSGIITDKETMQYNPTDEFIFPSIFHAGEHFEDPLGEWYLYYAPHDAPGGISLMYADSPEGPWTEYEANPIIANQWLPHYDTVSHVSTAETFWHPEEEQLFLYFHGENTTTRFATSEDGINFEYGDTAVTNDDGGPGTSETSYARVFEHPDETSAYNYAMFYMDNTPENIRRIRLAESVDAREWDVREEPLVIPGAAEGQNVSSANLWEWDGQLYVIYHASSGKIHARATNGSFTELGPTLDLHEASGVGADTGRVAAPDIITVDGKTYLFYEAGDRLGATIAYATLNPDAVRDQPEPPLPDPSWEQCPGAGSDEFDGTELDRSTWPYVVREAGSAHSVANGALAIPTYRAGVNSAPLIQQDVPDGAWEATTKVAVDPTAPFQQAGLLLYRDDANYAKFDLVHGSFGPRIEYIWRQNGSDRNTGSDSQLPSASLGSDLWLRLTSDGTNVSASVSYDGVAYADFGRPVPVATLAADRIGPFAMRGGTDAPEITASFDWFRWTPTAEELQACEEPEVPEVLAEGVPSKGKLSDDNGNSMFNADGDYTVTMDLKAGNNATLFELYENGVLIHTVELQDQSPSSQQVSVDLAGREVGSYVYQAVLSNSFGSTETPPHKVKVKTAP